MTTETAAIEGGELAPAPVIGAAIDLGGEYSVEQAVESLHKRNTPAESAEPASAGTESAEQADTAPEGTTAEDQENEPEVPAIDPPKSWSKEAHERWSKLDRDTQEFLAGRDSEDQKAIKRSLNEAAEARKAADAERVQWGETNKALAAKLPQIESTVQEFLNDKYPDIKTMDDVVKMAQQADMLSVSDPFTALQLGNRLKAWQIDQQRIAGVLADAKAADQRATTERQSELNAYRNENDKKFLEFAPEMSDARVKAEITDKAVKALIDDMGFSRSELEEFAADPKAARLLFHHGFQKLVYNNLKLGDLKAAPPKAIPKPVPAVQKPGVAAPKGAQAAESVNALRSKLNNSGSVDDAFALYQAKRRRTS